MCENIPKKGKGYKKGKGMAEPVLLSKEDAKQRLKKILAQFDIGNTSQELRDEAVRLAESLNKSGELTTQKRNILLKRYIRPYF